jgi:chemotaxis signal transduction protein
VSIDRVHGLNWEEVRTTLQVATTASQREEGDLEYAERILKRRARIFRRKTPGIQDTDAGMEVMYFSISGVRVGLEWQVISEVMPTRSIMPLPGSSAALLGICQLRGVLYPVLNPSALLTSHSEQSDTSRHIVIIDVEERGFGLAVDDILGLHTTSGNSITIDNAAGGHRKGFVAYLNEDRTPILDPRRLYDVLLASIPHAGGHPLPAGAAKER